MVLSVMSVIQPMEPVNTIRPSGSRGLLELERCIEIDAENLTIEVATTVVRLALNALTELDARIIKATSLDSGATIEFTTKEARDAALQASLEYGQMPCIRAAEAPPSRHRTRIGAIDCVGWVKAGKCPNVACPFRHPPPVARVPCRHWIRNRGECWYAEHCNFLHPGAATTATTSTATTVIPLDPPTNGDGGAVRRLSAGDITPMFSPPRQSNPIAVPRSPFPRKNPWSLTSAIPVAAVEDTPSSPRDGVPPSATAIGSPWAGIASIPRPGTPEIVGRPMNALLDLQFYQGGSGSFSSADDEIVAPPPRRVTAAATSEAHGVVEPNSYPEGAHAHSHSHSQSYPEGAHSHWLGVTPFDHHRHSHSMLDVGDRDTIASLRGELTYRDDELSRMKNVLAFKDRQIAALAEQLAMLRKPAS